MFLFVTVRKKNLENLKSKLKNIIIIIILYDDDRKNYKIITITTLRCTRVSISNKRVERQIVTDLGFGFGRSKMFQFNIKYIFLKTLFFGLK